MYREFSPESGTGRVAPHSITAEPPDLGNFKVPTIQAKLIRAVDIVLSVLALIWLAPLFVVVGLIVKSSDGGSIFFAQKRVGHGGMPFHCFKFRTMVVDAQARLDELLAKDPLARIAWDRDHKLRNDPRTIPFGNFLRKWSLDELPQFVNVLRGEMSIVGPRPIVVSEVPRYGRYFEQYKQVHPGITGLWQISGRNDVSYRRRVACDVLYVRHKSVITNLAIIVMTAIVVLRARGSY